MNEEAEFTLPGLQQSVSVSVDTWGVPHIHAASPADAFYGQGWIAARDRLFQLDLWLRRGTGRLAEAFGEAFVERDRAARLFLYRGGLDEEFNSYGHNSELALDAFASGVNAFIAQTEAASDMLPPEFVLFGYRPLRWSGFDIARIRSHGLFDNALQELERARTVGEFGVDVEDLRLTREPWSPVVIPAGLDLDAIHADALHDYRLAMSPVDLAHPAAAEQQIPRAEGSNNWVIAPSRTATGRPILANDPHRALSVPSLRYLVHLSCPEFDVIGAGEPMLPGVSIGHNGRVAFGLTIFPTDQEDLYVYELKPDDPAFYRYGDDWEPFRVVSESIEVSDGAPRDADLLFTRHGPVTFVDVEGGMAYAVRAAWLEPGCAPYLASLAYLGAADVGQFRLALSRWKAPSVNFVFADASGAVGWQAAGLVPRRHNWDGTLPVPGAGQYEWGGFRTTVDLPGEDDPKRGWIATANQFNLPNSPKWLQDPVSREWLAPYRYRRIAEVLDDDAAATIASSVALQHDVASLPARTVLELLKRLDPVWPDSRTEALAGVINEWDATMQRDSPAAALFEHWFRGPLRTALRADALQRLGAASALVRVDPSERERLTGDARIELQLLERAERADPGRLGDIVTETLRQAGEELSSRLGPVFDDWRWSAIHRTGFHHPAQDVLERARAWSLGPFARDGSPDTVDVSARDATGDQTVGATVRLVIDVGSWDESQAVNAPGQSGVPGSAHYDDLIELWRNGNTFPLLYTPEAVASETRERFILRPEATCR